MAISHENVAVRRGHDIARTIERVRPVAGHPRFAEGHQHPSFRTEFENLVAFTVFAGRVARPDVAITVDVDPDGRPPLPAVGERSPALLDAIWIVLRVCLRREHRHRADGCDKAESDSICLEHDSLPRMIEIALISGRALA